MQTLISTSVTVELILFSLPNGVVLKPVGELTSGDWGII